LTGGAKSRAKNSFFTIQGGGRKEEGPRVGGYLEEAIQEEQWESQRLFQQKGRREEDSLNPKKRDNRAQSRRWVRG